MGNFKKFILTNKAMLILVLIKDNVSIKVLSLSHLNSCSLNLVTEGFPYLGFLLERGGLVSSSDEIQFCRGLLAG